MTTATASASRRLRAEILELVRRVPRRGLPGPGVRARASRRVPCAGRVFDGDGDRAPGRRVARFLADHRPLRRAVRARVRPPVRRPACAARQLGVVGQPAGPVVPDLAEAGRPTAEARRRGDHRRRRLPDHRQPDHPEQPGAGLRRRARCPPTTSTSRSSKRPSRTGTRAVMVAHTLGNPFDLGRRRPTFAGEHGLWLIEDCCDAVGATYRGQAGRHLRRPGDRQLLPGPPHHDGRRGLRPDRSAAAQDARRVVPRLGPRLLVRPGQGQHLRQAVRLAARRPAARLRSQVHLFAHRLQPEAHRHAGGRRRGAARQARRLRRGAAAQLRAAPRGARATSRSSSSCPRRRPARTRAGSASRSSVRAGGPRSRGATLVRLPGRAEDRHSPGLRRQPAPPAGLPGTRRTARSATWPTPTS